MSNLITGSIINKSQLNNSLSKQMYSFAKSERFPKVLKSGELKYNLPNLKTNRATMFGYGDKFDFTLSGQYKTPSYYTYKCQVESIHPYAPSYSFGRKGRESKTVEATPGVGNYYITKPFGYGVAKYTMKGKGLIKKKLLREIRPGPGTYNSVVKINPEGKSFISNFKNVKQILFGKDKCQRFKEIEKTPGPGEYINNDFLFGKTIYNSKIKSSVGVSMHFKYKSIFDIGPDNDSPGPGSYESFSEFSLFDRPRINSRLGNSLSQDLTNRNSFLNSKKIKYKLDRIKVNMKSNLETFLHRRKS